MVWHEWVPGRVAVPKFHETKKKVTKLTGRALNLSLPQVGRV